MSLYLEQQGSGPEMVLLHGWGLHGGVWAPVREALAAHFHLTVVDLPGFGRSDPPAEFSLPALAAAVGAEVPAGAVWLGWSLGGLVAQQAAADGVAMNGLILTASTPRFVTAADWSEAMEAEVLDGFAAELATDYRATLQRFLALQARGSERAREELRGLRGQLFDHGEPAAEALAGGLELLRASDLRPQLVGIEIPTLWLHGERDTLVPPAAAEAAAAAMPRAESVCIPGAGHAPFLSHPEPFVEAVKAFLE